MGCHAPPTPLTASITLLSMSCPYMALAKAGTSTATSAAVVATTSQKQAVFNMHDLVHDLARSVMDDELLVSDSNKGSNSCEQKYCRYALLTNYSGPTKLSAIFPAKVRALHFLDCSGLELSSDAFLFAKCLRVLDLSGCPLSKLPECVTQLSRLQYLNLHGSREISALPESIGKIERLIHLDLSSCGMLEELPESLGNLKSLVHLELSVCFRVVAMPNSFCGLTKLQYLNFSNCSNLEKLPEAIGSLTELQYLNLSGCRKIGVLPESFRKLHNLVHLDMSRCPGVKGIPGALGDLTKLQYLDISRLSWAGEHLRGLSDVLGNLTELQYLNLSRSLNPILAGLPRSERGRYVQCISGLTNLEHLDISGNRFLDYLPESLGNLKRLHTLDVSGCRDLKTIPESIGAIHTLKFLLVNNCSYELTEHMKYYRLKNSVSLPLFAVHANDVNTCSNLHQLRDINPNELEICCLENVMSMEEARNIQLLEKQNLSKLTFDWTLGPDPRSNRLYLDDKDVLGELVPPKGLKELRLRGYNGVCFPTWLMGISHHLPNLRIIRFQNLPRCNRLPPLGQLPNLIRLHLEGLHSITKVDGDFCGGKGAFLQLSRFRLDDMDISLYLPNLVEIKLEDLPRCNNLPPLGQLPNLEELHLRRLHSITKIDGDFCGGKGAFLRLSKFYIVHMEQLEDWNTTYCGEDGMEEFMFPKLDELYIRDCPKLRLTPRPPIFCSWTIEESNEVISSWSDHVSHSSSDSPGARLEVGSSKVPMGEWRLLHHLPTLRELEISYCEKLTSLPENMQHLASLQSLELSHCDGISALPEWLGHLTSLEILKIYGCKSIKSLPQCIQQITKLKELTIWRNPRLKWWCGSEENKMKLAHIKHIVSALPSYPI